MSGDKVEYVATYWVEDGQLVQRFSTLDDERAINERVVRCRDCKEYRDTDATCHAWQWHNWDAAIEVDPDGFCAWGERRAS